MARISGASPRSSKSVDVVESLRDLLGRDVLLLPWPNGSKGTKRKWGHLTVRREMANPKYLAELHTGNIGVALGSKSSGLCSIDIDQDEELPKFLELNPALRDSCISKGRRGANIWVRIVGSYPGTRPLKIGSDEKDAPKFGEWRATGTQTIIHGIHPEGKPYRFLSRRSPVTIRFDEIHWPEYVFPKLEAIKEVLHRDDTRDVSVVSVVSVKGVSVLSVKAEDDQVKRVVTQCVPTRERDNHNNNLFRLARHVWTMQKRRRRNFSEKEIRAIVQHWFDLTPTQFKRDGYEDYVAEFSKILCKVRCSIGDGRFDHAAKSARQAAAPRWMAKLPTEDHRRLLLLCRELQRQHGAEPFFLSCRMAEAFFDQRYSFKTMAHWRDRFVEQKFLKLEIKGGQSKETARTASRFRYIERAMH